MLHYAGTVRAGDMLPTCSSPGLSDFLSAALATASALCCTAQRYASIGAQMSGTGSLVQRLAMPG